MTIIVTGGAGFIGRKPLPIQKLLKQRSEKKFIA